MCSRKAYNSRKLLVHWTLSWLDYSKPSIRNLWANLDSGFTLLWSCSVIGSFMFLSLTKYCQIVLSHKQNWKLLFMLLFLWDWISVNHDHLFSVYLCVHSVYISVTRYWPAYTKHHWTVCRCCQTSEQITKVFSCHTATLPAPLASHWLENTCQDFGSHS